MKLKEMFNNRLRGFANCYLNPERAEVSGATKSLEFVHVMMGDTEEAPSKYNFLMSGRVLKDISYLIAGEGFSIITLCDACTGFADDIYNAIVTFKDQGKIPILQLPLEKISNYHSYSFFGVRELVIDCKSDLPAIKKTHLLRGATTFNINIDETNIKYFQDWYSCNYHNEFNYNFHVEDKLRKRVYKLLKDLEFCGLNVLSYSNYIFDRLKNEQKDNGAQVNKCFLPLTDLTIAGFYHFPCKAYYLNGGEPIGKLGGNFRRDRMRWFLKHKSLEDPICKKHCPKFYCDFNKEGEENV